MRDVEAQAAAGGEPVFVGHANPHLPGDVLDGVWEASRAEGDDGGGADVSTPTAWER